MKSITFFANKIVIEFISISSPLLILNVIYFYKYNPKVMITKIIIKKEVDGVAWHNNLTSFLDKPLVLLLGLIRGEGLKTSVESTHILHGNLLGPHLTMIIETQNPANEGPLFLEEAALLKALFEEWVLFFKARP